MTYRYFVKFEQTKANVAAYEGTYTHVRQYVVEAPNKSVARDIARAMLAKEIQWHVGTVTAEDATKYANEEWRITAMYTQTIRKSIPSNAPSKNAKRRAKRNTPKSGEVRTNKTPKGTKPNA